LQLGDETGRVASRARLERVDRFIDVGES